MKVNLMTEKDIDDLQQVFEDDNMVYNKNYIEKFIDTPNAYAFVARESDDVVGFAYGYGLVRLDGKVMFYLHSIGILPEYQNKGYGKHLMDFIVSFAKNNDFSEVFVVTDKGNIPACKIYEYAGFENDIENEIVYVYDFLKK